MVIDDPYTDDEVVNIGMVKTVAKGRVIGANAGEDGS